MFRQVDGLVHQPAGLTIFVSFRAGVWREDAVQHAACCDVPHSSGGLGESFLGLLREAYHEKRVQLQALALDNITGSPGLGYRETLPHSSEDFIAA